MRFNLQRGMMVVGSLVWAAGFVTSSVVITAYPDLDPVDIKLLNGDVRPEEVYQYNSEAGDDVEKEEVAKEEEKAEDEISNEIPDGAPPAEVSSSGGDNGVTVRKTPLYKVTDPDEKTKTSLINTAKRMAPFAGATYCDFFSLTFFDCKFCMELKARNTNVTRLSTVYNSVEDKQTLAVIFDNPSRNEVVVAFRGSEDAHKALRMLSTDQEALKIDSKADQAAVRTHNLTMSFLGSITSMLKRDLKKFVRARPRCTVVFTGHSLGGSLAALAAPMMARYLGKPFRRIGVVTFGQPRVGNTAYAATINRIDFKFYLRVVNHGDIVPHYPPSSPDWSHVHRELYILPDSTTTRVCSNSHGLEDHSCSYASFNLNPLTYKSAHASYWDHRLTHHSC